MTDEKDAVAGSVSSPLGTSEQCGACHRAIYEEWKASYHGQAMTDPIFLELWEQEGFPEECVRCHAPVPLWEVDFDVPVARRVGREEGVSCLTCHQMGEHVMGSTEGIEAPCRPLPDVAIRSSVKMCFGCHNQHEAGSEWLVSPYGPHASEPRSRPLKTCLDCHMEPVDRPLVEGGVVRRGRRHNWPGGHDFDTIASAATLDVEVIPLEKGYRFRVWVTNAGAGHSIPTDARHRSYDVYVKLWDAAGQVLLDPLDVLHQARAQTASYRLSYRNTGRKDTQIPPLSRVSELETEKGYVDVPEARAGRGEAWLVYRLTRQDALTEASLSQPEVWAPKRARVVTRVPFSYGP